MYAAGRSGDIGHKALCPMSLWWLKPRGQQLWLLCNVGGDLRCHRQTHPLLYAPGDIAVKIACHLKSPVNLLRLAIACKCTWSVANEAVRRWLADLGGPRPILRYFTPSAWLGLMREIQTKEHKAMDERNERWHVAA